MASWLSYVYPLLLVVLACVAIYDHHNTTALSLPLSPALTILAVLLPLFSLAFTYALPALSLSGAFRNHTTLVANLLEGFRLFQLVLSVVLATSFFSTAAPTDVRSCLLGTNWQRLFATKDAAAIRHIQDVFECCGFNSVRDRAWPFAEDLNGGGGAPCAERFGRNLPCAGPWAASLERNAGLDGGIAVAVAVLQVVVSLFIRWVTSRQRSGWPRLVQPFVGIGNGEAAVTRPLLRDGEAHANDEDDEGDEDAAEEGQAGQSGEAGQNSQTRQTPPARGGAYGGTGPRVEPSYNADHGEPNAWGAD